MVICRQASRQDGSGHVAGHRGVFPEPFSCIETPPSRFKAEQPELDVR